MPALRPLLNLLSDRLRALPLLVLYLTDGCNSRCVTCNIWELARRNMDLDVIEQIAAEIPRLGIRQIVFSGGEAMQHPQWPRFAAILRAAGVKVMLLTNGLLLHKQAAQVIENIDAVTVSLDGATPATYRAIRGVDALPTVLQGIRDIAAEIPVTTRTTVQRLNFRELPQLVDVALETGVQSVSFLAVDVSNDQAFGPRQGLGSMSPAIDSPALTIDDLPAFAAVLDDLERRYANAFAERRIAESPAKLRRLYEYFAAVNGLRPFDPPRCNAPHLSSVIEVDGSIRPCFFLPKVATIQGAGLESAVNSATAQAMRHAYRIGERQECERCVCPLYQGPRTILRG
jgi:MoaA/NifB/PqqE/SkfB family radical SAM enzyme